MKILVLAMCLCAASAATFGQYSPVTRQSTLGNAAKIAASPFVAAAKVAASPFVAAANIASGQVGTVNANPSVKVAIEPVSVGTVKTANNEAEAEVVSNVSEFKPDGSYSQRVEISNGIYAESSGTLKRVGDTDVLIVKGSYKYTAPDGTPVLVTYIADENGYHAEGDSIPVGPPVPPEIQAAVEYIAKHAQTTEEKKF